MSEYEVYWVMYFPLINSWVHLQRFIILFEAVCTSYKKANKQVIGKIRNFRADKYKK